ncbi:ubiquitin-like-conjugating enzyme ATG10 [Narcine bancroftii]|uniref:ubiquitin-like-conjugating enzyme ATG10 n=1 Tax=Narcine bancroftii TaxID=1343680 RepID=UPI0038317688
MSQNFKQNEMICLGEEQFQQFCKLFIKHSDEISNGWEWRQKDLNEGYMVKVHLRCKDSKNDLTTTDFRSCDAHPLSEEEQVIDSLIHPDLLIGEHPMGAWAHTRHAGLDEVENVSGDTEEAQVTMSELIRYEYHVVYSSSYQAPVLYFRACYSDGRPLALKEIWESVHDCYQESLSHGPWDTITQQEHHLLGQPFFVLHPCRTSELMTPIMTGATQEQRNVNYITSWLSMLGPVVGLDLPLSYATAMSQDILDLD